MSAWESAVACGIYTISPLHVSTGQAEGAIDLPVAKEPHTGFPVIPASSLKGVARDRITRDREKLSLSNRDIDELFGAMQSKTGEPMDSGSQTSESKLSSGALVFTEARLIAFAARSLNRPFLYVTCRLVLERLSRDLRAAGITRGSFSLPSEGAPVLVADAPLAKAPLVLEDLVYADNVASSADVARIGGILSDFLPEEEGDTRKRFAKSLVLIPDEDFSVLVRRLPVRARIRLDKGKTTSGEDGNLWYEEQVPADCLFVSMVGARLGNAAALKKFADASKVLEIAQIGGNETVGEGLSFWTAKGLGAFARNAEVAP